MCGILCLISKEEKHFEEIYKTCEYNIKRRGPDHFKIIQTNIEDYQLKFAASILWLQGDKLCPQPIETTSSVFVYNGDLFGGTIPDLVREKDGDTKFFLSELENSDNIHNTLINIYGPYSFIYLDKLNNKLYFSRDIFGRRSLLLLKESNNIIITSVGSKIKNHKFIEIPAIGIFSYNLQSHEFELIPWHANIDNCNNKLVEFKQYISNKVIINLSNINKIDYKFEMPLSSDISLLEQINYEEDPFKFLLTNEVWSKNVYKLLKLLENAVMKRIITQPKYCHSCIKNLQNCNHCRVGILFSGGIDCTILALIADKYVDKKCPIDLLNVAFGNFATPDRKTGIDSFEELRSLRSDRTWNFVPINVSDDELNRIREEHIKHLIYPLVTILDDSLGCALWFASRGKSNDYTSPCRIVLVGMGADELFGGYTKHRKAYNRGGWEALHNSLSSDWENIAYRNLGRDDRVISDHGRQIRTPYLDEKVVEFLQSLKVWEKTFPSYNIIQGVGEKLLLRCLAYKIGLKNGCKFKKRALQFGTRIANRKENAHEESPRLK